MPKLKGRLIKSGAVLLLAVIATGTYFFWRGNNPVRPHNLAKNIGVYKSPNGSSELKLFLLEPGALGMDYLWVYNKYPNGKFNLVFESEIPVTNSEDKFTWVNDNQILIPRMKNNGDFENYLLDLQVIH